MARSNPKVIDSDTITVRVPITLRRRGGRKTVTTPDGLSVLSPARSRVDGALVKALARAFRWRKLIETGAYTTIADIAHVENINSSYVARVFRLTLLAPGILEAILDGSQPAEMTLAALLRPFPVVWEKQGRARRLGQTTRRTRWIPP